MSDMQIQWHLRAKAAGKMKLFSPVLEIKNKKEYLFLKMNLRSY